MEEKIESFLSVGKKAALEAASIILNYQDQDLQIDEKKEPYVTYATIADRDAENKIVEVISSEFPGHKIHGEEFGLKNEGSESDYLWGIDPLDGTSAYINQEATACINISLLKDNKPIVGVVYNPFTSELFYADNRTSWMNKLELPLIKGKDARISTLNFKLPRGDFRNLDVLAAMEHDREIDRLVSQRGSPAYGLALVAKGSHDFFLLKCTRKPKPEDYSAGILLVRNAGGLVTDLEGNEVDPLTEENHVIAGIDPKKHDGFLRALKDYGFEEKKAGGKIIFMGGLYGTGKSTLGKRLEEKLGYQRFNSDLTRRELERQGYDMKDGDVVWGTIFWKVGTALQEGKGIIMESTFLNEKQRKPDFDLARSKYADGMFIEVICPENIAKQRIPARPVSPDGIHVPTNRVEYYDKIKDSWTPVIPGLRKAENPFSYMIYDSYGNKLYEGLIREKHKTWAKDIADCLGVQLLPRDERIIEAEKRYKIT